MADQNLNIGIKVTSDTAGAKQATAAIDGVDKAVADLSKTEKEATNINGMYLDSLGRIHDASGKFVKVSADERAGLKERIRLQEQETGVVNKATVTGNGAAQTKREMAKAAKDLEKQTTQNAMGFMALSNGLQDVQYGLGGIVNNIPQIITGMGMGMGVAGAVQIAAVGVQFLLKNVDLFGEKAKQAARDAAELTVDLMADADAAYKNAEATKAATEAQERHNDAMQAADERYKEQIRLSDELIRQRQAEADAEIALADAQAGFEMAQIQLAEGRSEISKEDAITARNKVRTEADARKQTAAIAVEEAKIAEARKKAAAEDALARANRGMALQLQGEGAGMMTKDDRKLAETNMGSARSQLEQSKIRQQELAETASGELRAVSSQLADTGLYDKQAALKRLAQAREKLAKEQEEAAKLQADINREDQKLKKDKEAQLKTGLKGGDRTDLEKAVKAQFDAAKAAEQRASGFMGEAATGESGVAQSQRLFGLRQATGAMSAQAQIEAERRARQEEERRAQEKAAADAERAAKEAERDAEREASRRATSLRQVGAAGGSLASTLAGDGLAPGFADSLRTAAGGAGDAAGLDRLIAMVAKLAANSSKLSEQAKSKLDKLEAEIEDLRTAK